MGTLGHTDEALRVIADLESSHENGYAPALPIAWTYLGIGETAAALEWLDAALTDPGSSRISAVGTQPQTPDPIISRP
jgi:hypothetical protein